jgi:hypothetical protein
MSIYPLDQTKRYKTPGKVEFYSANPAQPREWTCNFGGVWPESAIEQFFGESLTEVVEMVEATHTWHDEESWEGGVEMPSYSFNCGIFPRLKPNTPVVMTVTMRYPKGSESNHKFKTTETETNSEKDNNK